MVEAVVRIRVWDLPTRLFHWVLAALVVALVTTGSLGGNAMVWHFRCGYALASLLLFRLVWGLVGGYWSRFANFWPTAYLVRVRPQEQASRAQVLEPLGHTPLGSLSILTMLFLLWVQVASGLFSDDELAAAGPLTRFVSNELVSVLTAYHTEVGKPCLLALIALHLGAIGYYRLRRHTNLVQAMISGDKELPVGQRAAPASRDDAGSRLLALGIWCLCALGVAAGIAWLG